MKLYYSPAACSLSPHIVLHEVGATFDLDRVDLKTHKTSNGTDFTQINPKGYVPALELDDGQLLTEGVAIVQYIADLYPAAGLAPTPGSFERARLQEHLNYIATELHKNFSPLFSRDLPDAVRAAGKVKLGQRLDYLEKLFADGRSYLMGEKFSVADVYLFVISTWTSHIGIDLNKWPRLAAFATRVAGREKVQEAMRAEGLI